MSARSVLIVDDEPLVGRMYKRMLARRGVHAEIAEGVEQARAALGRDTYDVVLSDVDMPDGSGFELASALQTNRRLERVVLMSGLIDDGRLDRARACGAPLRDKGDFAGVLAEVLGDGPEKEGA